MIEIISHRGIWHDKEDRNTLSSFEKSLELGFGIETDIRDHEGEIVISHDPPKQSKNLVTFDEFLFLYQSSKVKPNLALNIKADGEFSPSFDLMYGALELASGGTRISNREELENRIIESGLKKESFESHLRTYDWGMPPHSGWGFGFDRFLMVLTGKKNVREVVLYPREQSRLLP